MMLMMTIVMVMIEDMKYHALFDIDITNKINRMMYITSCCSVMS